MDTGWSDLHTYWDRVRWARRQWAERTGNEDTGKAAAAAMRPRMEENTYTTYERPPRSNKTTLDVDRARQFARLFKVSWVWLSTGEGEPFATEMSPEARSLAAEVDRFPEDQRKAKVQAIKALLTGTG